MTGAMDFEWIQGRLRGVLVLAAELLPPDTVALVDEMIDANECGLALEVMVEMIGAAGRPVSREIVDAFYDLTAQMSMDDHPIQQLPIDERRPRG